MVKQIFRKKRWLVQALVCLVLALASLGLLLAAHSAAQSLPSQLAAARWDGSGGYAQLSVFTDSRSAYDYDGVMSLRMSLRKKLASESVVAPSENARVMIDCWSAFGSLTAASGRTSTSLTCAAVGGDYFYFHPLELVSGYYFDPDGVTNDYVVLNELAAWRLFGATEVAGLDISIDGEPFTVVGVVRDEDDRASARAGSDMGAVIYVSYQRRSELPIHCYEVLLPNPVDGYASGLMTGVMGQAGDGREIVENSSRFTVTLEKLKQRPLAVMRTSAVAYPYWENAARLVERRVQELTVAGLMPALGALVFAVLLLARGLRLLKVCLRRLSGAVDNRIEARKTKKYYRRIQNESKNI